MALTAQDIKSAQDMVNQAKNTGYPNAFYYKSGDKYIVNYGNYNPKSLITESISSINEPDVEGYKSYLNEVQKQREIKELNKRAKPILGIKEFQTKTTNSDINEKLSNEINYYNERIKTVKEFENQLVKDIEQHNKKVEYLENKLAKLESTASSITNMPIPADLQENINNTKNEIDALNKEAEAKKQQAVSYHNELLDIQENIEKKKNELSSISKIEGVASGVIEYGENTFRNFGNTINKRGFNPNKQIKKQVSNLQVARIKSGEYGKAAPRIGSEGAIGTIRPQIGTMSEPNFEQANEVIPEPVNTEIEIKTPSMGINFERLKDGRFGKSL